MLRQLVVAALGCGLQSLKRQIFFAVSALFALILLFVALLFGLLAFYLWLSAGLLEPWQSALVIAGILLLLALLSLIVGRLSLRRHRRADDEVSAILQSLLSQPRDGPHGERGQLSLIVLAAVVGIVIGRRLSE